MRKCVKGILGWRGPSSRLTILAGDPWLARFQGVEGVWLLILIGAIAGGALGSRRWHENRLLARYKARGIEAKATITHAETGVSGTTRVTTVWFPYGGTEAFRYDYRHGFMAHTVRHIVPLVGDEVDIIYLPENPRGSVIQGDINHLTRKQMVAGRENRYEFLVPSSAVNHPDHWRSSRTNPRSGQDDLDSA